MGAVSPKKVAAIVGAVLRHASEEAPVVQAQAAPEAPRTPTPTPPLWAWAGRQSSMLDRVAWQRRSGKSW